MDGPERNGMKNIESVLKDMIKARRENTDELERVVGLIQDEAGSLITEVSDVGEVLRLILGHGRVEIDFWIYHGIRMSGYISFTRNPDHPPELLEFEMLDIKDPRVRTRVKRAIEVVRECGSFNETLESGKASMIATPSASVCIEGHRRRDTRGWEFGLEADGDS